MATVLHEAEGSSTEGGVFGFLIVFGVIGAITMIILGAIIPERVGPWWIYAAALVGLIALGWWAMGKSMVKIQLVEEPDGLCVVIRGQSLNVDERIKPGFRHWATPEKQPISQGGGVMMHFSVVLQIGDGRTISFRQSGGDDADGWPQRSNRVTDGKDVYWTVDIFGLQKALAERYPRV